MIFLKPFTMKDFAKERYLAVVRAFPQIRQERTQIYFMLSLTFISLAFLGIFAINPTLTTIVELNKKLDDSKLANSALKTKIAHLSSLHSQYEEFTNTWPIVNAAIPDTPQVTYIVGQIQYIATATGVIVHDLEVFAVELTPQGKKIQKEASYVISVTVAGPNQGQIQFLQALNHFNRVVSTESISFSIEDKQLLTVRLRSYFTP
jgi:hypothetical protein